MKYRNFLVKTLKEASGIANKMFGKVQGRTKPDDVRQALTDADLAIGKMIIAKIKEDYPAHSIIDEEFGITDKGSEYTWVIDPIDGTANFAVGVPLYGIMIGLLKGSMPLAGGVALPAFKEIYIAEKGKGAFCNDSKLGIRRSDKIISKVISAGFTYDTKSPKLLKLGSNILAKMLLHFPLANHAGSVYDSMMVAQGRYLGEFNTTSYLWDNVAQHIIIEEAGGKYTDLLGNKMDYSKPQRRTKQNFTYCAASPSIHKKMQAIIHSIK